jgi:cation diffusion facilitator family transporter
MILSKVRTLQLSLIAIASVVAVEGTVGVMTNSLSLLSDAAHALFDTVASIVLLVTTKLSLKPPDDEHMYGHGKIEPIGGLIGGLILIVLAVYLILEAVIRIVTVTGITHLTIGFWAVGYTLAIDCFRIATLWGRFENSSTMKASLYHAFTDFSSTIIALLGFGLTYIGFDDRADAVASIVLGALLIYLSTSLIRSSASELVDAISTNIARAIKKKIQEIAGNMACKELKVRRVGTKTFVETTICVPGSMGLIEAHDVASKIESEIVKSYGDSAVTIHIEPIGEERPVEKQIETLALDVKGVEGVHNTSSVYSKGKLFITLHALVDPKLSLEESHDIAKQIEQNIHGKIVSVESVTVHIEPYKSELHRELVIEDEQLERIVRRMVEAHLDIKRLNRVVTYISQGSRYINIECSFEKSASIEAIHETVTHIEGEIKRRFREAVVTIHAEP